MLERAECHLVTDCGGDKFFVQFWDTHTEDRDGRRRMAVAIWEHNPSFPSAYSLAAHTRRFYGALNSSCDGPEAARAAVNLCLGHIHELGELSVRPVEPGEEITLI